MNELAQQGFASWEAGQYPDLSPSIHLLKNSAGLYTLLKQETLDSFMDYNQSMQRLQNLEGDVALGETAARLIGYAKDANKFD
jgi:hypothetical protein